MVGVTGNLAAGKSHVAGVFQKMGAEVMDADKLAKKVMRKDTDIHKALKKVFGPSFFSKSGSLNRRKLAWHVFSHPRALRKLNILTHPGVILEVYKAIEKRKNKKGMLVIDAPLLFEAHMEKLVDLTVLVRSSEKEMLSRAERRGVPEELAKNILGSQWPSAKKEKLADFIIENNGTLAGLEAKAKKIWEKIRDNKGDTKDGY